MVRRVAYLFGLVVLVASGGYLLVYLYRWEWNRAVISGLFFLAALVALSAALILDRLKMLERRLMESRSDEITLKAVEESFQPEDHFAWLRRDTNELSVFVPVLMGAGVFLSAVAWGVEKIALTTARPVVRRRLAMRLAPISGPMGSISSVSPRKFEPRQIISGLVLVGLCAGIVVGVDALGDLTQNRRDPFVPGSTSMVLDISTRGNGVSTEEAATMLFTSCRSTVQRHELTDGITVLSRGRAQVTLSPVVGKYAERRLKGCLEDATLDNIQANVSAISQSSTVDVDNPR